MPPGQDDNPFGTPRGAWGRQPPTTFGLGSLVKRPTRTSSQIRVPAPGIAPRNILTGGVAPRPSPTPPSPQPPPEPPRPVPAVEPPDPSLVSDPVLVRASAAPKRPGRGLPFPPVAGIGVLIAAILVVGLMLLRREPPAPILPPPLAAPPIIVAPPTPAPAAAVPPPIDPEAPMTTRLPEPQ